MSKDDGRTYNLELTFEELLCITGLMMIGVDMLNGHMQRAISSANEVRSVIGEEDLIRPDTIESVMTKFGRVTDEAEDAAAIERLINGT